MQLADAIANRMAKEGQFVPDTHPTVTKAVREAERALGHGVPLKVAVAFAVAQANNRAAHTLKQLEVV